MAQFERGGMNIGRWPADLADTEGDGTVTDDSAAPGDGDGGLTDTLLGRDEADQERLAGLPEHEIDTDTSVGGGLMSSGTMAEDHGGGSQPVPGEERTNAGVGDQDDRGGLPLGDALTDR